MARWIVHASLSWTWVFATTSVAELSVALEAFHVQLGLSAPDKQITLGVGASYYIKFGFQLLPHFVQLFFVILFLFVFDFLFVLLANVYLSRIVFKFDVAWEAIPRIAECTAK